MRAAAADRRPEQSQEACGRLLARLVRALHLRRVGQGRTCLGKHACGVGTADRSNLFGEPQERFPAQDQARCDVGRAPMLGALYEHITQRPLPLRQSFLELIDLGRKPA
jgi:hypothetical protein